jgi:hypothetical protein
MLFPFSSTAKSSAFLSGERETERKSGNSAEPCAWIVMGFTVAQAKIPVFGKIFTLSLNSSHTNDFGKDLGRL